MKKELTLCFIQKDTKILLGMKKRGFGVGKWNGFGGKVNPEETIEEATKREMLEESGIKVSKLKKRGIVEFKYHDDSKIHEVHIFKAGEFKGEPIESEEMRPQWFEINEIPLTEMWADDKYWMPLFLKDKKFKGTFLFGEEDVILENVLEEIDELQ